MKRIIIMGLLPSIVVLIACSSKNDSSTGGTLSISTDGGDGGQAEAGDAGDAGTASEDQPVAPCHPNATARQDVATITSRGDVARVPAALKARLLRLAARPHSQLPLQIFAEADSPSQLFQYYLIEDRGFEPNTFSAIIPGKNDLVIRTATGTNCGLQTIGSVRLALEPKPDLPTDPNDVRAFIDVFTDIHGLFVINNESGWYEGWMIHDMVVPAVGQADASGRVPFGKITQDDANQIAKMGSGNNVPGNTFTVDGNKVTFPSDQDHFPDRQTNVVPIQLSMGAYNSLQQSDAHAYWEFNYQTNWVHPLYELPFTGGFSTQVGQAPNALQNGTIGSLSSLVPGSGPNGKKNDPKLFGDDPNNPRDPDRFNALEGEENMPAGDPDAQREKRMRFIPSGLANEIMLDVYMRPASFNPQETALDRRLFLAYAAEVARVDTDGDGVISAVEGDVDTASDGFKDNARLFIPATQFKRFAVTREINDGYLAPRFAPSQRAWVLSGNVAPVSPAVASSEGRDSDDR